jgi:hypothetical protein
VRVDFTRMRVIENTTMLVESTRMHVELIRMRVVKKKQQKKTKLVPVGACRGLCVL